MKKHDRKQLIKIVRWIVIMTIMNQGMMHRPEIMPAAFNVTELIA